MKKFILLFVLIFSAQSLKSQGTDAFLGQILFVPFNFAPKGWAECNGQLLPIAQNTALFSLLGTTYGGNGQTTFALPDMRGRVLIGDGAGSGLSSYVLGQTGGEENHTLLITEMPSHTHTVNAVTTEGNQNLPTNSLPANTKILDKEYSNVDANTQMNATMIATAGGNLPHENRQPFITFKCIIALQGIFPSRN